MKRHAEVKAMMNPSRPTAEAGVTGTKRHRRAPLPPRDWFGVATFTEAYLAVAIAAPHIFS